MPVRQIQMTISSFLAGLLAGYGIAIPVGAIAVLILETSLARGFRPGFWAGAGAATADFLYASLAALAGNWMAAALAPLAATTKWIGAGVLLAIGFYGLSRGRIQPKGTLSQPGMVPSNLRLYSQFLGLTLLNPLTIVYFSALILGGGVDTVGTTVGRGLFVCGAGVASLSWQTLLAGTGAFARRRLSSRFRQFTSLVGNLIVITFGVRILLQALLFRR